LAYGVRDPRSTLEFDKLPQLYEAADYFRFKLEQSVTTPERDEYEPLLAAIKKRVLARAFEAPDPVFPTTAWRDEALADLVNVSLKKLGGKEYAEAQRIADVGRLISVQDWEAEALMRKTLLEIVSRLAPVYAGDSASVQRTTEWLSGANKNLRKLAGNVIAHFAKQGMVHSGLDAFASE
jgi:hypothetical protein